MVIYLIPQFLYGWRGDNDTKEQSDVVLICIKVFAALFIAFLPTLVLYFLTRRNSTVASVTFSVMLLSGRPDVFWDRIDRGDDEWLAARDRPWGRVAYVLASDKTDDLIRVRFPQLFGTASERGFAPVYRTPGLALYRVARHGPSSGQLSSG